MSTDELSPYEQRWLEAQTEAQAKAAGLIGRELVAAERQVQEEFLAAAIVRAGEADAKNVAFNNARDRRLVWMTAVGSALQVLGQRHGDAGQAAVTADAVLAEYDKRWPE